jgi:hypothetical protein
MRMTKEIMKSTRFTMIELAGIISRGKYIFVSIFEFVSRELLASLKDVEKNCQGNIAA